MRFHVVDRLTGSTRSPSVRERPVVSSVTNGAYFYIERSHVGTSYKSLRVSGKDRTLGAITDLIIERSYTWNLGDIALGSRTRYRKRARSIPTFTEHQDGGIDSTQTLTSSIDCVDAHLTHLINTETIHVVLGCPIFKGIVDEFSGHRAFICNVIANTASTRQIAVGISSKEVTRDDETFAISTCVENMVVNHVHNHPQTLVVHRLNCTL